MDQAHPDLAVLNSIRSAIEARAGGAERLQSTLPHILQDAIDFVIDPIRTARTTIGELDNVEKTFIGLKVEHFFRDFIDVPKGVRDLRIDGVDVDIKNTVGVTWMIPPETYRSQEPCVLFALATERGCCSLGLILARTEYLSQPNRDSKRGITAYGRQNILWIVKDAPLPASKWAGIDMVRFREMRSIQPGANRAAAFFRENLRKAVHRSIIRSLLFDQEDYMKRLRENGGARDVLRPEGIALISGTFGAGAVLQLGLLALDSDEWIAVKAINIAEEQVLRRHNLID